MTQTFFVTGTDTEVGKTFASCALLQAFAQHGISTVAMKPVAAGCDAQGQNEDAVALMQYMSAELSYKQVNPVALAEPIAPHIAAANEGRRIRAAQLEGFARALMLRGEDILLIEGAGGWLCPLNNKETLADLPRRIQVPAILVVGMKLGCLNHALLTVQAMRQYGVPLAGWIANQIDPDMHVSDENISYLQHTLPAPCLGVLPFAPDISKAAEALRIEPLVGR